MGEGIQGREAVWCPGKFNPELGSSPWGCWPLTPLGHKAGNSQSSFVAASPVSLLLCKQRSEETKSA